MIVLVSSASAQDEFSEWILIPKTKYNDSINQGMIVYQIKDRWFIDIEELSQTLQFNYLKKKSIFMASFGEKEFAIKDFLYREDLNQYLIAITTLNEVFNCSTRVDSKAAIIIFDCQITFPAIAKINRNKRQKGTLRTKQLDYKSDGIYQKQDNLSGPFADMNLSIDKSSRQKDALLNSNLNTVWGNQNNSLVTFHNMTSRNRSVHRFTYYRNNQDVTSPYYTEIRAIDSFAEGVPLIRNTLIGKGVTVTNFPKFRSNYYSKQTISGPLQIGWEVELYRDGQFLGIQSEQNGQYIFKDIFLQYGKNNFILKFYGPYGEKTEKIVTYDINGDFIPGKVLYNASVINEVESDNYEIDQAQSLTLQYPLTDFLIIQSFIDSQVDNDSRNRFSGIGLDYLSSLANMQLVYASDQNDKSALSYQIAFPFKTSSLQLTHTDLRRFESPWFFDINPRQIDNISSAQYLRNFQSVYPFLLQLDLERTEFYDFKTEESFQTRLSTQLGQNIFDFTHRVDINLNKNIKQTFNHQYNENQWRLRHTISLLNDELNSLEVLPFYQLSDRERVGLHYQKFVQNDLNYYGANWGKRFTKFAFNLSFQSDFVKDHQVALNFNIGVQRDSRSREFYFAPQGTTDKGAISIKAFYDLNYNNQQDEGEEVVSDLKFVVMKSKYEAVTNQVGEAFIGNLPLYWPLELQVDLNSLDEPSYYPYRKSIKFACHRGKVLEINYPIVQLGESDTYFLYSGVKNYDRLIYQLRVRVFYDNKLLKTVKVDESGFLYLSKLKIGKYRLEPFFLDTDDSIEIIPKFKDFEITREENFINGLDFELKDL